jgi:hypothetical protein
VVNTWFENNGERRRASLSLPERKMGKQRHQEMPMFAA